MAKVTFIKTGGGTIVIETFHESIVLGHALKNRETITAGSVFKPATRGDRDTLVAFLQSLDYTARTYTVELSYDVPGEGIYRVNATRQDTRDELDTWVADERHAMAKRLGLKDPLLITVTIAEVPA